MRILWSIDSIMISKDRSCHVLSNEPSFVKIRSFVLYLLEFEGLTWFFEYVAPFSQKRNSYYLIVLVKGYNIYQFGNCISSASMVNNHLYFSTFILEDLEYFENSKKICVRYSKISAFIWHQKLFSALTGCKNINFYKNACQKSIFGHFSHGRGGGGLKSTWNFFIPRGVSITIGLTRIRVWGQLAMLNRGYPLYKSAQTYWNLFWRVQWIYRVWEQIFMSIKNMVTVIWYINLVLWEKNYFPATQTLTLYFVQQLIQPRTYWKHYFEAWDSQWNKNIFIFVAKFWQV